MNNHENQPLAAPRAPADHNPRLDTPLDFPDRDFGELTPDDYDVLGFMSGLEVHQQLLTTSKLFCRCPAGQKASRVDAEVLRHMRPTLSELGEYDGTALMEFKTHKEIVYRLDRNTVCTYEIDDTPPFLIDLEAVKIAIEACRLMNVKLVSELHVMRKQYLDGSIPTGFQRTAMVAVKGELPFRTSELGADQTLRVRQVSLEEDSCREVSDIGHRITYQPDRLGIPLIETVTEPDLLTPLDVQAGGRLLAQAVRATGKVRRGAGAARQDVNVSIAGGRRVEIKGVGNHRRLPQLVHIEAYRQLNLLRIKAELERRGVTPELFEIPDAGRHRTPPWVQTPLVIDARRILRRSNYPPVREALEQKQMVCAVRLPGFRHILAHRTQPGITFAREIRGRVRVIACLESRPFMIHSDVEDYGLAASVWRQLRAALRTDSSDAIVVLWGSEVDAGTAAREVLARAAESLIGIPAETRQSYPDGTTGFERILPGPDRMYPDTDTPPLPIEDQWIAEIDSRLPETPWAREDRLQALGLDVVATRRLAASPWATLFDEIVAEDREALGVAGLQRVAAALEKRLPYFWRQAGTRSLPAPRVLTPIVQAMARGELHPDGLEPAIDFALRHTEAESTEYLAGRLKSEPVEKELESLLQLAAENLVGVHTREAQAVLRWGMGQVMPALSGRIDPCDVRSKLIFKLGLAI